MLAQGVALRSSGAEATTIGHDSAVLENSVMVSWAGAPVRVGRRTVFGHRCLVIGATVGDLCEVGNGSILLPGSRLGSGCVLGEGTLVPAGVTIPDDSVLVGRPARRLRTTSADDRARVAALRDGEVALVDAATTTAVTGPDPFGGTMGTMWEYRGIRPTVDRSAVIADSAELTGDVVVGAGTIIGSGVRIIGDSHGPVRIGAGVQILENSVLHLLPDNSLVLEDDVIIGPGAMIHGCHIGRGSVVEPGAIVCDFAELGDGCLVTAGSVVPQRRTAPARSVLTGFPAAVVAELDAPPPLPGWALDADALSTLRRVG